MALLYKFMFIAIKTYQLRLDFANVKSILVNWSMLIDTDYFFL